jgi:hypothetical protein
MPYIVQNNPLHKATYLAACLTDKGGRFIAYQLTTKYLEVYDVSGKHRKNMAFPPFETSLTYDTDKDPCSM